MPFSFLVYLQIVNLALSVRARNKNLLQTSRCTLIDVSLDIPVKSHIIQHFFIFGWSEYTLRFPIVISFVALDQLMVFHMYFEM